MSKSKKPTTEPTLVGSQHHSDTAENAYGTYYLTCGEDIVADVERYRPANKDWGEVSGLVRDVVARTAESTHRTATSLMRVVGPFVLWCVATQGLEQDVKVLFVPKVIDAYCSPLHVSGGTIATYRSALTATARVVNPGAYGRAPKPLAKRSIQPPYAESELTRYRNWANGQRTALLRQKGRMMLALMAGAGLSPKETICLRVRDVVVDDAGILLTVGEEKTRRVAVLEDWEEWIRHAIDGLPAESFVWGATPHRITANVICDFTASTSGVAPSSHRLRATWVVSHLTLGTPIKVLFQAGGITKMDNLDQYLVHVPDIAGADARAALRGGVR